MNQNHPKCYTGKNIGFANYLLDINIHVYWSPVLDMYATHVYFGSQTKYLIYTQEAFTFLEKLFLET